MSGNKNKKAVLDSNVIIDLAKQIIKPDFVEQYSELCTSIISYIEVLGYDFGKDLTQKELIMDWLDSLPVENLSMPIAEYAIEYRKKRKIKLPDALILATAKYLGADLITSNEGDFKDVDSEVKVIVPQKI